jgi:hypothetical protein
VGAKKPGKVSWIHGTKLKLFSSRVNEWKEENEKGHAAVSVFYKKITNLYFLKYGYDMKDDEDLAEDIEDPTDPDATIPGSEGLSEEEANKCSELTETVRKVRELWSVGVGAFLIVI